MAEGELNVSACLLRGLTVIQMLQLPSGQVATFHQTEHQVEGQQALGPVALPSAQVHDALASFDPSVMGSNAVAQQAVVQAVAPAQRAWFCSSVRVVRRRLRGYLRAERQADGTWRRHGRGSGSAADLATTACASVALSQVATGASASRFRCRVEHLSQRFGGVGRDLRTLAYRLYLASLAGAADAAGLRQQILDQLAALEPPQPLEPRIGLAVIRAWRLAGFADAELQACWPNGARAEGPDGLPQSAEDRAAMACVGSQLADWSRVETLAPSLQADLFAAPNSGIAPGEAMSIAVRYAWAMSALGQWAAISGRCRR